MSLSARCASEAVGRLAPLPDFVLVDAFRIPRVFIPQGGVVGGDRRCAGIAAASVVAKVTRDRRMTRLHAADPRLRVIRLRRNFGQTAAFSAGFARARGRLIVTADGDLAQAVAGQSIPLTLADEIDVSRGDVLAGADAPPEAADQFEATLVWMGEEPLLPGRAYGLKLGTRTVSVTVQPPKYEINVNTLEHLAAKTLDLNAIGVAEITTDRPIVFEPYADSRALGGFILIDKLTHATVAAGMLHFSLRRAQNVHWQALDISRDMRARQKAQTPRVLWFTGLSGSGKSTIANLVEKKLYSQGLHTFLLDGDNVRHGLNKDLGFTDADRIENIRRVGEVARLMTDAGLTVLTAFISPFRAEREMVRAMMADGEFIEVFVDTPIEVAEARDVKGLYAKARSGQLRNFTGIDSPYEAPEAPDIHIDTTVTGPDEAAEQIVRWIFDASG